MIQVIDKFVVLLLLQSFVLSVW